MPCGKLVDRRTDGVEFRVSAVPFSFSGEEFTVCALHDITDEKRRQVLECIFFHDILNAAKTKGMAEILKN